MKFLDILFIDYNDIANVFDSCSKHIQSDVCSTHPFIIEYWGKPSHERTKHIEQKPKTCGGWVGNIELPS